MATKILVLVKDKLRPVRDLLRGLNPIRFTRFDKYFIKPIDKNYEIKSELKKQICIFISSRNNYVMLKNEILLNFNLYYLFLFILIYSLSIFVNMLSHPLSRIL